MFLKYSKYSLNCFKISLKFFLEILKHFNIQIYWVFCVESRVHKFVLSCWNNSNFRENLLHLFLISIIFSFRNFGNKYWLCSFFSLTMAYGIGRNISLLKWEINEADFLWNWNYFSSLIQISIYICKYLLKFTQKFTNFLKNNLKNIWKHQIFDSNFPQK